ncbi:MAG: extracellular solute-binding protein [Lachnospiraceae bacterium]|nr:extracellular solute-binding protein [Lachnospiraceae bacterium]
MLRKIRKKGMIWVLMGALLLGGCGKAQKETELPQKEADKTEEAVSGTAEASKEEIKQPTQFSVEDLAEGEKYQITLGCNPNLMPQLLEAAIVDFNKSNQYYEVVVREYDWQEGQQRLEADLATGNGPDLFDLSMIYVDKLVRKGLVEDLSPYLEDGQGMEREDIVASVLLCNTKENVLTCIPPRFTVDIMLGKKSLIGEKSSWTVEDFLKCVENNEGMQIANSNYNAYNSELKNRFSIIYTAVYKGIDNFIDVENNKADFDREEFVNLLTLAKEYQADAFDYESQSNFLTQVQEEKLLLCFNGITSVSDYMLSQAAVEQEAQFIGFPTYDGSSCYGIRNYISYGMNVESQVKAGAWAFLEFLISYRLSDPMLDSYGFYTSAKALEEQFAEAMEKEYEKDSNWEVLIGTDGEPVEAPKWNRSDFGEQNKIEAYAAREKDIENLRAIIDGASYAYGLNSNSIYQIVQEEVYHYLGENKSPEETVSLIQNRVQLYLDENN